MSKKKYNFIDLFSGCGGLTEGFLTTGRFKSLAHVEWGKPMVNTMRKRLYTHWSKSIEQAYREVVHFDMQKTDELINGNWSENLLNLYNDNDENVKKYGLKSLIEGQHVDLIIGGPPCQAYSIHGRATDKNSMEDDYRNYLFESFVKIVDEFQPDIFVFENVAGLLTAHPGGVPVRNRIYEAFKKIGYDMLQPEKLREALFNAVDFNVPQNRPRVIIFGIRHGSGLKLTDLYNSLAAEKNCARHLTVKDAIGNMPKINPLALPTKIGRQNVSHKAEPSSITLHEPRYVNPRDMETYKMWIAQGLNHVSHARQVEIYKERTGKDTLYTKYRNLEWDKPSPTVVAHLSKDGHMFIHPDIEQARSITIREAALLMTFPLDFEFVGSNPYCFKMIGNAVPVNFANSIGKAIINVLDNNYII
jgi:DNA (cytosine-5)-methyltransferase 1